MEQETNINSAQLKKRRSITKTDVQQFLLRGRAFIALILVMVVFSSLSPQFLTTENIVIMSKHVAHQRAAGDWHDLCHPDRRH